MTTVAARRNYETESDIPEFARAAAGRKSVTNHDATGREGLARVEEFLQSLARAVRQFHTYPATSPKCIEALDESHRALAQIEPEHLACIVSPRGLLIAGNPVGGGTLIEHELARRLYDARVLTIDIDRATTRRELLRLCVDLAATHDVQARPLAERLVDHGVERIVVGSAYRPEVLAVEAAPALCTLVEQERERRESLPARGRAAHLYPPDKGWVRVDPGLSLGPVSLPDLALLIEDPATLAHMLARLAGESPESTLSPTDALEQKFGDVAMLFRSLEPRLARARFSKLASAVLTLDTKRRRRLLSGTVLPGLVDGRPEGDVLGDFPDVDLADALSLLLDVETAAPELLTSALDRLKLSEDRRRAVAPLLESRIRHHMEAAEDRRNDSALAERTQQLIKVASGEAKTFEGFTAFDLGIDEAAEVAIAGAGEAIAGTDLVFTQLACITRLIALTPNPEVVERVLAQGVRLLSDLERERRWTDLASWLETLRQSADAIRESRPDVVNAVASAAEGFFAPGRLNRLLAMYDAGGEERSSANRVVVAAGWMLSPALLTRLKAGGSEAATRGVAQLICDHASLFARPLAASLDDLPAAARGPVIRALGAAGRGYESQIARQLAHADEGVVREALRALARVGSGEAAEIVVKHLQQRGSGRSGGDEAIWHFPAEKTRSCVRALLGQRAFVVAQPEMTLRILERAGRGSTEGLADLLGALAPLRFRLWKPRLARIGRKAHALLNS